MTEAQLPKAQGGAEVKSYIDSKYKGLWFIAQAVAAGWYLGGKETTEPTSS